jgi:hypothetical protein
MREDQEPVSGGGAADDGSSIHGSPIQAGRDRVRELATVAWAEYQPLVLGVGGLVVAVVLWRVAVTPLVRWARATDSPWRPFWGVLSHAVARWIDGHSTGVPWSAETVATCWWIVGAVVFLAALLRTAGGRIGWILFGGCTITAVYGGTAPPAQSVAAGTAAVTWMILSIPALNGWGGDRRLTVQVPGIPAPGPEWPSREGGRATPQTELARPGEPDPPVVLAEIFETLLRRRTARAQHAIGRRAPVPWVVRGGPGARFEASPDPADRPETDLKTAAEEASTGTGAGPVRQVVGLATLPDAVAELLATAEGTTTPRLRWDREELRPALWEVPAGEYLPEPPSLPPIEEFLRDSPAQTALLVTCLGQRRAAHRNPDSPEMVNWELRVAANQLNLNRPLLHDVDWLEPVGRDRTRQLGCAYFYDWVHVTSIVKTQNLQWNGFGSHRPEQVGVIASGLLSDRPEQTVPYVLGEGGHLHLLRIPGPAGPLHEVITNGLHRTHAFALLDLPIIAAEISVSVLPTCITVDGVTNRDHLEPDQPALWRGLIRHGLLEGRIETQHDRWSGPDPTLLYPVWTAAPWMLLGAHDAALTAGAYERVYPGALLELGVPAGAIGAPNAWRRWLTGR